MVAGAVACFCYLRLVQEPLADGKTPLNGDLENHLKARLFLLRQWLTFYFCKGPLKAPPIWKESLASNTPRMCIEYGGNLERRYFGCRH